MGAKRHSDYHFKFVKMFLEAIAVDVLFTRSKMRHLMHGSILLSFLTRTN